jgi:hypothetical protein
MCSRYSDVSIPECSGNGVCQVGRCICDSGFTSRGDFETDYHFDCDINISAVKVLSIILIIFAGITFILGLYNLSQEEMT